MTRSRSILTTPRLVVAAVAVMATFGLAACGSQIDPNTVRGTGGGSTVLAGGGEQSPGAVDSNGVPVDTSGGGGGVVDTSGGGVDTSGGGGGVVDTSGGGVDTSGGGTGGVDSSGGGGTTSGGGGGTSGGGGGTTSGGGGGSASANPTATSTAGGGAGGGGTAAGNCDGFKNQTGITDSTITIGNSSDLSGPVPGLFASAADATQAYIDFFNASGQTICGRKLAYKSYDSKTDAGADQQSYTSACSDVFAMVGSMSGYDSGGAATAQGCGLPDIRAISVTPERTACTTCYAAQPAGPQAFENAVPDFIKRNFGGGQHAAMLYLNGGAAAVNGPSQAKLETKRGMHFDYIQAIDTTEFNYAPFVQAMKDKGVETVQFVGATPFFVRMAQAMQQGGFTPKAYLLDPTAYASDYTGPGADAVDNTIVFLNFTPFEEAASNRETATYISYLQQVDPSAEPNFFGVFAWSAADLFVHNALALGGKLTRASLVASMKTVDNWTGDGIHSPQHVGSKNIADCWRFIKWTGSVWTPLEGTKYQCTGLTS